MASESESKTPSPPPPQEPECDSPSQLGSHYPQPRDEEEAEWRPTDLSAVKQPTIHISINKSGTSLMIEGTIDGYALADALETHEISQRAGRTFKDDRELGPGRCMLRYVQHVQHTEMVSHALLVANERGEFRDPVLCRTHHKKDGCLSEDERALIDIVFEQMGVSWTDIDKAVEGLEYPCVLDY